MQVAVPQSITAPTPDVGAKLLERLIDLTRAERAPPCIRVRANRSHSLSAVNIDQPLLVLPLRGRKRVRDAGRWIHVAPGEIFVIPQPTVIDIDNIPDQHSGLYLAIGIPLEQHVLNAARHLVRQPIGVARGNIACVPFESYIADLTNWLDALERDDLPHACHAVVGIVLRLYAQGHRSLLYQPAPLLSARVRATVSADPARDWSSHDLEHALAMSGATLRRHLAVEGMSLRRIIADARLSHSLTLLLTTTLPVKSVAVRVGYASVSSFIKRFRDRYGVEPSRVGVS
jgi:AraC-like DNA-binding protein